MYTSLHNRSCYSFGSALSRPEDLVAFVRYHGMPAVALTDLDGMYAVIPFYQACRKAGIKPIIGAELSLEDGVNITLLARSMRGYANLCRLVSLKQLRASPYPTLSRVHERMGHPNANLFPTLSRVHERMGHPNANLSPTLSRVHERMGHPNANLFPTLSRGHERMGHPNANLSPTLSRVHERMGHPGEATGKLKEESLAVQELGEYAEDVICLAGELRAHEDCLHRGDADAKRKNTGETLFEPEPVRLSGSAELTEASRSKPQSRRPVPHLSMAQHLQALREVFGRNLYVELAIHDREGTVRTRRLARLADEMGIPVVASCESRCMDRQDGLLLRALQSIGTLTLLDQPHPDKPPGTWHFRTPAEMEKLFGRRPDALHNTLAIAEQCEFDIDLDRNRFPAWEGARINPAVESFATHERSAGINPAARQGAAPGKTAMQHLRELCIAGCKWRYVDTLPQKGMGGRRPTLAEALARLERELAIIDQVHYAEYFLVFHEIVEYCRSQGIATLARGSAADSLVCYALGVSHACPFRFDLPFDRFLNPERAKFSKMADIDLDLPWDQRDQVIRWVFDRWGHDRVAMIGLPNTFHARAAVAELGKIFGLPAHEVHKATRLLPHTAAFHIERAISRSPEARDFPIHEEPYRTILQLACSLEGIPHHWAMHPCGAVVSPEPLAELVPVQRSPKGYLISQYDMDVIEAMGFVKIDLLGQAGLSVLRDTVEEIHRTDGRRIDLHNDIDYSDPVTWHMIATGGARGVHHIESPAMTSLLRQCNCRDIDCLTTIVAIIRPGAANQGKKELFARRYQGFEPPEFVHPSLVGVLEPTYGIMVFEEHILQIATEFAGMNLGRADVLRRALNKENRRLIAEMKDEFWQCARQAGRGDAEIEAVWGQLEGFCGFMFNKAHSAEYAVEAFQGAWLKHRWPAHYLAAILSNYRGFYAHSPTLPQILYVMEALRLGIGMLPPCVNRSGPKFRVELETRRPDAQTRRRDERPAEAFPQRMIRVPIMHIKGISQEFVTRYLAERDKGPFASLDEFLQRCRPGEAEAMALLDSGALDGFGLPRPRAFWQIRRFLRFSNPGEGRGDAGTRRRGEKQHALPGITTSLVSALAGKPPVAQHQFPPALAGKPPVAQDSARDGLPPVDLTAPDARQVAQREMELLGFPITIDPLTFLGQDDEGRQIDWSRYVPVNQLDRYHGRRVTVCGLMIADRINLTTGGDLMKFVSLADRTGVVEAFLFPDTYRHFGHLTVSNPILAATGVVEPFENRNGFNLRVEHIAPPWRHREE